MMVSEGWRGQCTAVIMTSVRMGDCVAVMLMVSDKGMECGGIVMMSEEERVCGHGGNGQSVWSSQ